MDLSNEGNMPNHDEIKKEFEDFVHKKFNGQVQAASQDASAPLSASPSFVRASKKKLGKEADRFAFALKPREITAHLDRFVIGQDEAKKALAIAVCDHYNSIVTAKISPELLTNVAYAKQNVLILGPTGVGKTYLIKQIAKLIGVPFVKADATRFSETGYMGANVDDLIKDLVQQADGHLHQAQVGIIYLDEADKLASSSRQLGRDVSGRGVQLGLLKLMEETEVDLRSGHDPAAQMQAFLEMQQKGKIDKQVINTKHILFIISGAFTGLEDIISKRLSTQSIGFKRSATSLPKDRYACLHFAATEDFITYGFEPEFIGRLPVRVACDPLDKAMLLAILKNSEESLLRQYQASFQSYGIELSFADEALEEIAARAEQEKTGARALMTVCEKLFRDFKYELPSTDIFELRIDRATVLNPQKALSELLATNAAQQLGQLKKIRTFEQSFSEKYQMKIKFSDEACRALILLGEDRHLALEHVCHEVLLSYEHGLKLIQQNTGKDEFVLGKAIVDNPHEELEKMVKESYNHRQVH